MFTKRLEALAKEHADDVLLEIQNDLLEKPDRGTVIQGTGGVRKARAAGPARGKGKRGGFRYLYYYIERDGQIFLLMVSARTSKTISPRNRRRRSRRSLANYRRKAVNNDLFNEMIADFAEAKKYRAGKKAKVRVFRAAFEPVSLKPKEIRGIRVQLGLSQPQFAEFLCTSIGTVRSWEQGSRKPQSSALRLLAIAKEKPAVLLRKQV